MPHDEETPREPVTDDAMVAALLREREGYVRRRLTERVAEVDEQIKRHGGTPPTDGPPPKTEVSGDQATPRGRRPPGKSRA